MDLAIENGMGFKKTDEDDKLATCVNSIRLVTGLIDKYQTRVQTMTMVWAKKPLNRKP